MPGTLEDAGKWLGWLDIARWLGSGVARMEVVGTSAIAVIAIGLSTSGLWVPWLVRLRKQNADDIATFRGLYPLVISCEEDLAMWIRQTPDLADNRVLQLETLLLAFRILCGRLDRLKVWTPSTSIDDFDEEMWQRYLLRIRTLISQGDLYSARKSGRGLVTALPTIRGVTTRDR